MFSSLSPKELEELKIYIKNYKNEFRDKLNLPGNVMFGCEVEFNSPKKVDYYEKFVDSKYEVTTDASGVDIVEIKTPKMHNTSDDWNSFKEMISSLKKGFIAPNTGGHIHYDCSIVDLDKLKNLVKLWYSFENVIYEFSTGEYEHLRNSVIYYAKQLEDVSHCITRIEKFYEGPDVFRKYDKEYGLNLANHFKYKDIHWIDKDTYEVRVPNGSLNVNIWQNNVEFFGKFMTFANNDDNKELINKLYKQGRMKDSFENRLLLADLLYDNDEDKLRFLNQFELDKQYNGFNQNKGLFSFLRR